MGQCHLSTLYSGRRRRSFCNPSVSVCRSRFLLFTRITVYSGRGPRPLNDGDDDVALLSIPVQDATKLMLLTYSCDSQTHLAILLLTSSCHSLSCTGMNVPGTHSEISDHISKRVILRADPVLKFTRSSPGNPAVNGLANRRHS